MTAPEAPASEASTPENPVNRRRLLAALLGAAVAGVAAMAPQPAEARRWGAPPGWSRGRKRGWRKRGGPKWRW